MLIVNSYDEIYNLDNIEKIIIEYVGIKENCECFNVNAYFKNNSNKDDDFPYETLEHLKGEQESKQILQDILDAYAKGTKVFYIDGRIV